jgi:hypothetical protein
VLSSDRLETTTFENDVVQAEFDVSGAGDALDKLFQQCRT